RETPARGGGGTPAPVGDPPRLAPTASRADRAPRTIATEDGNPRAELSHRVGAVGVPSRRPRRETTARRSAPAPGAVARAPPSRQPWDRAASPSRRRRGVRSRA